ncbi:DEAD/DEAH box helicase [Paenibacillus sp. MMS18-CY102]|uniref:DEAD/DEAH box helicase n=1 Tax=Paenibacillus sp. MMS18-CY102 TaxID=2682849 RepID=UPI0013655AA0|nr:DEAD/DEAH box helicase [Paenibacillus sp. MMS18-CY102]MWC28599.1 ATP-dependent helicase [Paenibacillus sp. MMS18-CY102]
MRGLDVKQPLVLDARFASGEGVYVMEERHTAYGARLKRLLFAWHASSWYGAEIENKDAFGRTTLLLPPLLAIDYLDAPQHVRLLNIDWTEDGDRIRATAVWLRRALMHGWFVPDSVRWTVEQPAWKADVPDDLEPATLELWRELLRSWEKAGQQGAVDEWLSLAVNQLIETDKSVSVAWHATLADIGSAVLRGGAADEEDWLVAAGIRKDVFPFRIALQLAEPDDQHGWRLRPAVQHRDGGAWMPLEHNRKGDYVSAGEEALPDDWLPLLGERLEREQRKWQLSAPDLIEPGGEQLRTELTDSEAYSFLESTSLKLLQAGCPVLLPSWWETVRTRKFRLKAKMKSSVGSSEQPMFGLNELVQFDWKLAVGNVDLSEAEFMKLAEDNRKLMRIDGEWVHLEPEDIDRIKRWMKQVGRKKGLTLRDILEIHLRGASPVMGEDEDEGISLAAEVELNSHLSQWLEQLQQAGGIPDIDVPDTFRGQLRPYQLQGVSWLAFLRRFGLGSVLADDMGLGKTVQFTVYLLYMKQQHEQGKGRGGPALLVCPTSVIGNWEKELERFAPGLKVMLHYGPKRDKGAAFAEAAAAADVVITSYSLVPLDEEDFESIEWNVLCLDEAQNIKNVNTKQSAAIRRLPAYHRIAMTGTPMENRLTELWSIFDFINPGYLGRLSEFRQHVVAPIERTRDEEAIAGLQRWTRPFMLRRVKSDPAIVDSLPDKNEAKMFVSLTAEQGALYENIVAGLLENLDKEGPMRRRGLILSALTKLKQLCDHPQLFLGEGVSGSAWDVERSNKTLRLVEMIEEIAAEGEKCLVFTQFVDMGLTLQRLLEDRIGLPVPYLHGGVPKAQRDTMIDQFQNQEVPGCAFVLSLKAGGTGLNLTAANHVFHFDRWWNPAVENQATDRAFRIGQTKKVQVHKFVTLGTLEERIDQMIDRKQSLNDQIVSQSEQWVTELSTDELRELFALRRDRFAR